MIHKYHIYINIHTYKPTKLPTKHVISMILPSLLADVEEEAFQLHKHSAVVSANILIICSCSSKRFKIESLSV